MVSHDSHLPAPLTGIVPPLITPLSGRDQLDQRGFQWLIEHVLAGGVHGLFILGTTGESAGLSNRLRREVIDDSVRHVAGRVPVLVGIADTVLEDSLALARHAADAGADAVVISTPYYLELEQSELLHYATSVAAGQPLPVFLYNIPFVTRTAYELDTIRRLMDVPNIVGLKDSSGDMSYLLKARKIVTRPDFTLLVGQEHLLPDAVAGGCHGAVTGGANVDPRLFVRMYDAAVRGDLPLLAVLQARLLRLDRIYRLGGGVASVIRGIKCALSLMGICSDRMADPYRGSDEVERVTIQTYLADVLGPAKSGTDVQTGHGMLAVHDPRQA